MVLKAKEEVMKRKLITLSSIVVMSFASLVGCSSSQKNYDPDKKIILIELLKTLSQLKYLLHIVQEILTIVN